MPPTQPPRAGEINQANSTSVPVGTTAGPAETTSDLVEPKKGAVTCPNCKRSWPVRPADTGSTLPCLCGFLIEITG